MNYSNLISTKPFSAKTEMLCLKEPLIRPYFGGGGC
jgi:hypothetical protein